MLEEKFTACYCRHPFILAFDFKYAWNVWRRRCSHSQTVYNTAKSISLGNTYTKKLSQKSFHLHQPHFGFGRNEVFFFLNIVRSSNKKHGFVCGNFWVPPPLKPHKLTPQEIDFYDWTSFRTPEIEHNKK